jgi:hypothetical protein
MDDPLSLSQAVSLGCSPSSIIFLGLRGLCELLITFAITVQGQFVDVGMFMASFMLLAREAGLHTCAQEVCSEREKRSNQRTKAKR